MITDDDMLAEQEADAIRCGDRYRVALVRRARAGDAQALADCRHLAAGGALAVLHEPASAQQIEDDDEWACTQCGGMFVGFHACQS